MIAYAAQWATGRNPYFVQFENDCTNFVSQIVAVGGWEPSPGLGDGDHEWRFSKLPWGDHWTRTWSAGENWYWFARKYSQRTTHLPYVYDMVASDVLQVTWNGDPTQRVDHTMFVSRKRADGELLLSYHTNDQFERPFQEILAEAPNAAWYTHSAAPRVLNNALGARALAGEAQARP